MSEENVEMVRRAIDAWNRGDWDEALKDVAPEAEYTPTGALPERTGVVRGTEAFKDFFDWVRREFAEGHAEVGEVIDAGDTVVGSVTLSGRGRQSGAAASWTIWEVVTVKGGKIVRGQAFTDKHDALEAAGLRE